MTTFEELPATAAWRHVASREGLEAAFIRRTRRGWRLVGHTTAIESGRPWTVRYDIGVDARWHTRSADVWVWSEAGHHRRTLRTDGAGRWTVDGSHVASLDGCLDVDLEASALTNTLPVHRLGSEENVECEVPAAYVRVSNLEVERLEQRYVKRTFGVYDYVAPAFDFGCQLRYDGSGLVLDYPGIAVRLR